MLWLPRGLLLTDDMYPLFIVKRLCVCAPLKQYCSYTSRIEGHVTLMKNIVDNMSLAENHILLST